MGNGAQIERKIPTFFFEPFPKDSTDKFNTILFSMAGVFRWPGPSVSLLLRDGHGEQKNVDSIKRLDSNLRIINKDFIEMNYFIKD